MVYKNFFKRLMHSAIIFNRMIHKSNKWRIIHGSIFWASTGAKEKMDSLKDPFYRRDSSLLKLLKRPGRLLEIIDYFIFWCKQCTVGKKDYSLLEIFYFFSSCGSKNKFPFIYLYPCGEEKKRLYSATKFILYTAGGSIFLLMGVLGIGLFGSTEPTLNFEILTNQSYPVALEIIFYIGFFLAFAVKLPIIPLHTWLPDTHGEAHYSTCMLLAGILLKMGAYGLVRINMELFPHAHSLFSPWLIIVGAMQIIYAASTSLGQRNLKKRIAYSSVSHMGFIIIGIGSITDMGLNGALLQIISHGFIGAALFFLAGTTYDRIRLVYLDEMGGIAIPMPKIFTMFSSFSMASLALPGMSGFVAELIVFFGLITSSKYVLMTKLLITFVMAIGMILTPIYLLSMLRQMFYGYKIFNGLNSYFFDSGPRELFLLISIFLPVFGIGMYPDFVLSLSVERVEVILSNSFYR
uniref:NADH-plastoquinone oxidoreductase subunit 4 n=1 Tax=Teucrium stocksianum subsp. stenophyllum TaxID=2172031 RepID=A0A4Y6I5D5_9LAMI|nr:NADH-plastoquinone oxidoreductase subunit 4 [Teucrium stocksianum subsp. stenophyllum]